MVVILKFLWFAVSFVLIIGRVLLCGLRYCALVYRMRPLLFVVVGSFVDNILVFFKLYIVKNYYLYALIENELLNTETNVFTWN